MKFRVIPPATGGQLTVEGQVYKASPSQFLDVEQSIAPALAANGWFIISRSSGACGDGGGVGTTAQRPFKPFPGQWHLDTTLGKHIVFDDAAWRDAVTAATAQLAEKSASEVQSWQETTTSRISNSLSRREKPQPPRLRLPLNSLRDVQRELARVYRALKVDQMSLCKGRTLVYALAQLSRSIEGSELEQRIALLEQQLQERM